MSDGDALPGPAPRACFIDGAWSSGTSGESLEVTDAATNQTLTRFELAGAEDASRAVAAARDAWPAWANTTAEERAGLMERLAEEFRQRIPQVAASTSREIGTPSAMAAGLHGATAAAAIADLATQLRDLPASEEIGNSLVLREPVGVVAAITAWNYPTHQMATKVAPALAAGCAVVAKPAEIAPLSAVTFIEACAAAGFPAGVVNLVIGTGPAAGEALVADPRVDMVSFTGSTAVGRRIAATAAPGLKRLALELGGKSASVILSDADLPTAVRGTVRSWLLNNSQTCAALTRLVVPRQLLADAEACLVETLEHYPVGDPQDPSTLVGPLISRRQQERVRGYIESGLAEGARLVTGGLGLAPDLAGGNYVAPTVFSDVRPDMRIAREEIFGPVLCVLPVADDEEAIEVANDSSYGLSGAVWSADEEKALAAARRLRTGQVSLNGGAFNITAPFGGYKESGIGREGGRYGLAEYFEYKAVQR